MLPFEAINRGTKYDANGVITMDEYRRQERELERTCKQFEGTMFSKIWKDMMKSARNLFEQDEKKRLYGALEDTTVEMVSEHLSESQGIGVWKVLYDSLHARLPEPAEIQAQKAEERAERAKSREGKPIGELYRAWS